MLDSRALIKKYELTVSQTIPFVPGALASELETLVLSDNERGNKNRLQMLIVFFEQHLLEEYRHLLNNHTYLHNLIGDTDLNKAQILLFPLFEKRKYSDTLIRLILSDEAFYMSAQKLEHLGLVQDLPEHLHDAHKRQQLKKIHRIKDEACRDLALIFWAKGDFSDEELTQLLHVTQEYPELAATLIDLDTRKEVIYSKDLKHIAFTPSRHLQQSLEHHYAPLFRQYMLKPSHLARLNEDELKKVRAAWRLFDTTERNEGYYYDWILGTDARGQLLRELVPSIARVSNTVHQKKLITYLYQWVQSGVTYQEHELCSIQDKPLRAMAALLQNRYVCTKQIQTLDFRDKDMVAFAADGDNEAAHRFRHIILRVEEACKHVHKKLRSASQAEQASLWRSRNEEYRKALYRIAYEGLKGTGIDVAQAIKHAEEKNLQSIDPESMGWVQSVFIVLANIVITALTLSAANFIHHKNTGAYWFFFQQPPSWSLHRVNEEIISTLCT